MSNANERWAAQSAEHILGPNPFVGFRLRDLATEAATALGLAASEPGLTLGTLRDFGAELLKVVQRKSELAPAPTDRRFKDESWQQAYVFRVWLQSYLAMCKSTESWVGAQGQLDDLNKARLAFALQLATDALAPSNFPLQPSALKMLVHTRGKSAVNGLRNYINDIIHNRGLPAQVDKSQFEVGRNLATTKGKVVLRIPQLELIQYTPTTDQVREVPILVVPPQINKFYVFDLSPEKSVARFLLAQGFQVYVISWFNPTTAQADWGIADYANAIDQAVDKVNQLSGTRKVNVVGACAGGATLSGYMATRPLKRRKQFNSLTLMVSVLDLAAAGDTSLGLFATPAALESVKAYSRSKGVFDGQDMASAFAWLRPNDLIWNYWVNNVLLGNKPPAFDVLYWNNDGTRLPAQLHCEFIDIYAGNLLATPKALKVDGVPVDLGKITCDTLLLGGTTDHITPWKACYRTSQLLGGKSTFILSNSGHIQSILNPPGGKKAEFWVAPAKSDESADEWLATAKHEPGSWWNHWGQWLHDRSGKMVAVPKTRSRTYRKQGAAPGSYVFD